MSEVKYNDDILAHIGDFENRVQSRHKKKIISLISRIVFFVLITATLLTYFLSPLGKVKIDDLQGNYYYSKEEITALIDMNNKHMLSIDEDEIANKLDQNPRLKNVQVKWTPFHLNVKLNEIVPLVKTETGEAVLSNGVLYDEYLLKNPTYDLSLDGLHLPEAIFKFTNDTYVIRFLENLKLLAKQDFANVDYIDITYDESEGSKVLYFGIYYKLVNDTYLRIRSPLSVMKKLYQEDVLKKVISSDYGELKFNEEKNISYQDAVCFVRNNKLSCGTNKVGVNNVK